MKVKAKLTRKPQKVATKKKTVSTPVKRKSTVSKAKTVSKPKTGVKRPTVSKTKTVKKPSPTRSSRTGNMQVIEVRIDKKLLKQLI